MNYGTVNDGVITAPLAMCSSYEGIGAWHTLTDEQRAEYGWYKCDVVNESFNAFTQTRSENPELSFDGVLITAAYTVIDKSLPSVKSDMRQALAEYRFDFETAGLVMSDGLRVMTDRESQSQLSTTYHDLKNGLIPDTDWKADNAWQLVSSEEIEPIARAVAAHRRGCFRGERQIRELIDAAATVEELEAINIALQFGAVYREAYAEVQSAQQASA